MRSLAKGRNPIVDKMDLLVLIANSNDYDGYTPRYQELAVELGVSKQAIEYQINLMDNMGLLERTGVKHNQFYQRKTLNITGYGRECIAEGEIV